MTGPPGRPDAVGPGGGAPGPAPAPPALVLRTVERRPDGRCRAVSLEFGPGFYLELLATPGQLAVRLGGPAGVVQLDATTADGSLAAALAQLIASQADR